MTALFQDFRYACRLVVRHRAFTAAAALVLALGTGATSTVFSIVDAILFRPLVGHADGMIVGLYSRNRTEPDNYRALSYPDYVDLRGRSDLFASLTAHNLSMAGLTEGNSNRRILVDIVTANFFDTFGAPVAMGRPFTADEERPNANIEVAILSHALWRRMGAREDILSQTIRLNGRSFTVVGVAAEGFGGSLALVTPELWVPTGVHQTIAEDVMRGGPGTSLADRQLASLIVLARLKPDATIPSTSAGVQAAGAELAQAHPTEDGKQELMLAPLSRLSISTRPTNNDPVKGLSVALISMATIVLLIASFNLANMLLARGGARRKEFAVRLAIGGSRARLLRQLVIEGFVLALVGGALGMLLASLAVRGLLAILAPVSPVSIMVDWAPDYRMLATMLGSSALATLVFATLPGWRLARTDAVPELKEQAGELTGRRTRLSLSNLLVTVQLAFSVMILTVAALTTRGAIESASADPGFSFARGILVEMDTNLAGYNTEQSRDVYQRALERVRARPGIAAVSLASLMPFGEFSDSRQVQRPGPPIASNDPRAASDLVNATFTSISADYFSSIGLALVAGHDLTRGEDLSANAPPTAIIDEPLAHKLFHGANPIGESVQYTDHEGASPTVLQIVGVAPGLRDELFDRELSPHLYVPYGRAPRTNALLHVRTTEPSGDAEGALLPGLRRELLAVDPDLPILGLQTLAGWRTHNATFALERVLALILGTFGGAALFLATMGLYGLKAYMVSRRTREIGIRVALGATPANVVRMILSEGLAWSTLGLGVGAVLAVGAAISMRALTYQGRGPDPVVPLLVTAVLGSAGFFASWLPARRASRIAPVQTMRQ